MASPVLHPDAIFGEDEFKKKTWKQTILLSFQIIGIVYGQLSTAPLYVFGTMREGDLASEEVVYGLFSFIFWSLTIISLLKYAVIVLKADDKGEGGTFALYSLLCRNAKVGLFPCDTTAKEVMLYEERGPSKINGNADSRARRAIEKHKIAHYLILFLALYGSCMTIGDAVLTPALSVSSSKHTQDSVSNALKKYVPVPSACVILVGLFMLQPCGSEAMFADLGHFSKKSIKITFICLIYPLLVLCYAGQAAYISKNLNVQYLNHLSESMPRHCKHLFIVLSLLSSAVGSQATITACFSIINQCLALNCFPRVKVIHTSKTIHGQIYIPDVNWLLMIFSLTVTVSFRDLVKIGNATVSMTIMLSWHYGTMKKYEFDLQNKVSTEWLIDISPGLGISRVPGIGFIYTDIVAGIPAFFSHFITNLPAFHQVLILVSFKSIPVPYVPESERDTGDFEEQIIRSIGEFISIEQSDIESMVSPDERMIVVGNSAPDGNALVPLDEIDSCMGTKLVNNESQISPLRGDTLGSSSRACKKKKVRFMLPANSPKMQQSVRKELLELIDARESGSAYFLGQSYLVVRDGSNFLKRFFIMAYRFSEKNCREPPVALKIPHAALVEVGMVCSI
ncbi:Potassium transporter [Sesbania bispinosa]|nr:Potassium transporter [Sesbania bispinosa]